MAQLIMLRQVIKKHNPFLNTCFQWQKVNKISQCAVWLQKSRAEAGQELQVSKSGGGSSDVSTDFRPLGEKIVENAKTASYTGIILMGVGAMIITLYAIFQELFSGTSANSIYSMALDRVIQDTRVQDSLGAPIKGYGEESRRGRRQRVAHSIFSRNGVPHIRMKFYVQGIRNKATVHLESKINISGNMEFRYLFLQLDNYPHTTIILEDNRASDSVDPSSVSSPSTLSFGSFDDKN